MVLRIETAFFQWRQSFPRSGFLDTLVEDSVRSLELLEVTEDGVPFGEGLPCREEDPPEGARDMHEPLKQEHRESQGAQEASKCPQEEPCPAEQCVRHSDLCAAWKAFRAAETASKTRACSMSTVCTVRALPGVSSSSRGMSSTFPRISRE